MRTVIDASAILAFLGDEEGAHNVEQALERAFIGAANWSEVAQKVLRRGGDVDLTRALLGGYDVTIEPVIEEDAVRAAALWREGTSLSLGDRLCLALGERFDARVLTADRAWGAEGRIVQIR